MYMTKTNPRFCRINPITNDRISTSMNLLVQMNQIRPLIDIHIFVMKHWTVYQVLYIHFRLLHTRMHNKCKHNISYRLTGVFLTTTAFSISFTTKWLIDWNRHILVFFPLSCNNAWSIFPNIFLEFTPSLVGSEFKISPPPPHWNTQCNIYLTTYSVHIKRI